ncbi:hypothetical protein Dimus_037981 [Dionaea muscipula]
MEKSSLWIQWVHHMYLKGESIWNWIPAKGASGLMKMLAKTRNELLRLCGSSDQAQAYLTARLVNDKLPTSVTYELLQPKDCCIFWGSFIWHKHVEPKMSFILWRAMMGRLCMKDNLRWELDNRLCLFCGTEEETTKHLFFKCRCLLGAWNQICCWCDIPPSLTSLKALVNWIKARSRSSGSRGTALKITLAASVYFLWKARNDILWKNVPFYSVAFIRQVKIRVYAAMISHFPHAVSFAMI